MKNTVRLFAALLAALLICTALGGCFGSSKPLPEKQTVDKVYRYTTTELLHIQNEVTSGEEFNGSTQIGQTNLDANGYLYTVQELDKNYAITAMKAVLGSYDGGETVEIALPVYDNENGYRGIRDMVRLPDGLLTTVYENVLVDEKNYVYENRFLVEIYNMDGTLRSSLNVSDLFEKPADSENYYFGIENAFYGAGDLFVTCYGSDETVRGKLFRFGLDGTKKESITLLPEGTDGYVQSARMLGENKLLVPVETYTQNDYKQQLVTIDLNTGERTETDVGNNYEIMYRSFVGADGGLYYSNENGIFSFDLATGEEEKLVDFLNSDYIYRYGNFFAVDRDKFVTLKQDEDYEKGELSLELSVLTKVPDEELVPKYLVTVASAGGAYSFREQIVEFNLASEEYRIKYLDYSEYNTEEDYQAGQKKLQEDILAGNVPDVLITDQEFSAAKYANKNLFLDLYTFIDQDPVLTRDKFLDNVLAACETNGKLYEIPTNMYLMGFMGHKDKIGDFRGLTLREFTEKVKALPEGVTFFREGDYSRENLLEVFFFINYVNFLDPATGLCRLNNDEFKAMLEWLATQPEKSRWEQEDFNYETFDHEAYQNMYKEGKAIATWTSLDSFNSFLNYSYDFGDAPLDFIGAPAPDREGMVFTATNLKFLVSAKSAFPEQAWNFVKVFFTEENQRELGWGFPVTKAALDAEKQEALDEIARREAEAAENSANNGIANDDVAVEEVIVGGSGIVTMPVYPSRERRYATVEDVEAIYGYVKNVKKQMRYDSSILDIIKEEASEYFGGKKSIDDAAAHAESRINIKLGEQM